MNSPDLSRALARASSGAVGRFGQRQDLARDQPRRLRGLAGGGAGVDAQHARVLIGLGEGVDVVGETPLLANMLEQARGHAAAQRLGEQPKGEIVGIEHAHARKHQHQVRLLQPAHLRRSAAGEGRRRRVLAQAGAGLIAEPLLGQAQGFVLVQGPGEADGHAFGAVEHGAPRPQTAHGRGVHALHRPQDRTAQRSAPEGARLCQVEDIVVRRIGGLGDLLGDDALLPFQLGGVERGPEHQVAGDLAGQRTVALQRADLKLVRS
jgi:hypothetical protein